MRTRLAVRPSCLLSAVLESCTACRLRLCPSRHDLSPERSKPSRAAASCGARTLFPFNAKVFAMARAVIFLLVSVLVGGLAAATAHEGHDHGDTPRPAGASVAPRGEAQSDAFEMLAVAHGGEL